MTDHAVEAHDDDMARSGRSVQLDPWLDRPAGLYAPDRRGRSPLARFLVLVVVLGLAVAAATAVWWLMEDEAGRNRIERKLENVPLVRALVPDPERTIGPLVPGGGGQAPAGGEPSIVYPAK